MAFSTFPTAIDTDASLFVTVNNAVTSLTAGINASTATIPISSFTNIRQYQLITIDAEIMKVVSAPSASLTVIRGFDGSTAAAHVSGAEVNGYIDSAHQSSLKAAVIALENIVGASGSNITKYGVVNAENFNFSVVPVETSITAGVQSLTLPNVPLGVNHTDTGHLVYISGGTGAAEAVLITGGNALSGGTNGTVIVNILNSHSGGFTVSSSTAGIQEALQFSKDSNYSTVQAGGPAALTINSNINLCYVGIKLHLCAAGLSLSAGCSIVFSADRCTLSGNKTNVIAVATTGDVIKFTGSQYSSIKSLFLGRSATAVSGSGISFASGASGYLYVEDLFITQQFDGIRFIAAPGASMWSGIWCQSNINHGLNAELANDDHFVNSYFRLNGGRGINAGLTTSAAPFYGALKFLNCTTYQNTGDGVHIESNVTFPCSYIFFTNCHIDTDGGYEVYCKYAGPVKFTNCEIINGNGVYLGVGTNTVKFPGTRINGSNFDGLLLTGNAANIDLTGLTISDSSQIAPGNQYAQLKINGTVANVSSSGLRIGAPDIVSLYGIYIETTGGSPSAIHLNNCQMFNVGNITNPISIAAALVDVNVDFGMLYSLDRGINNALIVDVGAPLYDGMQFVIKLAHSLQVGANTIQVISLATINNGAIALKSSRNPANNIAVAYVSGGLIRVQYSSAATAFLDLSQ